MTLVFRQIDTIEEKGRQKVDEDDGGDDDQQPDQSASLELFALLIDILSHSFQILPFTTQQNQTGGIEEYEYHTTEVQHIAGVDNALADRRIMVFDAEGFQIVAEISERIERVDECKSEREDEAEQRGDDEGHDLVVGEARREESDGDERCAEEEQAEVGAPGAAHVDITDGVADPIDRHDIDEGRQKSDDQQGEAGEELRPYDLHVAEREGEQEVHRAGAFLLGKGAHGDGRHQKQEQELREVEKSL